MLVSGPITSSRYLQLCLRRPLFGDGSNLTFSLFGGTSKETLGRLDLATLENFALDSCESWESL